MQVNQNAMVDITKGLVTNYGEGGHNTGRGGGGHLKVYHYEKGGRFCLAMLKGRGGGGGGHKKFWGSFYAVA